MILFLSGLVLGTGIGVVLMCILAMADDDGLPPIEWDGGQ